MPIATLPPAMNVPARLACRSRQHFRLGYSTISALVTALALCSPAKADESPTLIIPPDDGYGLEECLSAGSPCGLVVADAWCKAHGFAGSKGYGPAGAQSSDAPPGSFHVTCGGHLD